ncbi:MULTISPECIES: putative immunity/bacteriocin fusion bifunctional protein [Bacillus cereus group]|uniref:putative immunity/bacteriocin fusion bifunctional protein n=1 Tax=Bacillus cereus group TaxID=86661 RepID=UPI000CD89BC8|nr:MULTISPECIES: putative immunity/bacteriocin fusion bifunctional protein [Bacillus cereus group]UOB98928.1 hypothetical protein BTI679_63290 [Bacillus wiedmannii]
MKKVALLLLTLVFSFNMFLSSNQAKADSLVDSTCKSCDLKSKYTKEEAKKELEKLGVEITDTNTTDKELVKNVVNSNETLNQAITEQKENGFKLYNNAEMYLTYENTYLGGFHYDKAVVYASFLQNTNGDAVVITAWVDAKKNKVIKYEVGKVTKEEPKKYNSIVSYEKSKEIKSGFKFNGQSFACGMSGVFACITYCGVVGLACGPAAGACGTTCDLVCGAAFAYACS